jgi:LAS superfamily LD-carboxypeptidase LdcB
VDGRRLDLEVKDPLERGRIILKYSSMPGTSRHHWGTEVDLNVLANSYYTAGEGKVLYQWLRDNAGRYGFCQPYTKGRKGGYDEEMWHWSYVPLAKQFLHDWNRLLASEMIFSKGEPFACASVLWPLASEYVNDINGECR